MRHVRSSPGIIAGATSPEQVEANARAVAWQMTPDDLAAIDKATQHGSA